MLEAATKSSAGRSASATAPPTSRSATTNKPLRRANGNTAAGRRVRDLYRAFMAHLGNPGDTIVQANVLNAAELTAAAENERAKLLAGDGDVEQIIRLENLASRAVRRLGVQPSAARPGAKLDEHLARLASRSTSEIAT
jgi:hypothetical protein